jgi:hypothetical protein
MVSTRSITVKPKEPKKAKKPKEPKEPKDQKYQKLTCRSIVKILTKFTERTVSNGFAQSDQG